MKEILIETGSCLVAAMLMMIWHEVIRLIVYACCQRSVHCFRTTPWKVWRYIDPIGLILSLTSCVPISKPYFYRVRDPITNRRLGVAGLVSLLMVFAGSILVLRFGYGGVKGLDHLVIHHWWQSIAPIFVQYLAMLSFGMFVANLFPVSTFDMGLLIAGTSPTGYLGMLKVDGTVKLIFVLVLLFDLIHYGASRLILLLL